MKSVCPTMRPPRHLLPRFSSCTLPRTSRLTLWCAIIVAGGVGCKDETPRPPNDTITPSVALPESLPPVLAPAALWDSAAGSAFLVVGGSPQEGGVIFPEFTSDLSLDSASFDLVRLRDQRVDLIAGGRVVGEAVVGAVTREDARNCPAWPRARLSPVRADSRTEPKSEAIVPAWTVAFASGRTTPIAVDSIETLSRADSALLAVNVAKVASALPQDTSRAFRGLPFNVRSALRFSPAPGVEAFIAEVRRSLNLEADPRQEHLLIIGERDTTQPGARFETAYFERSSGPEESVETTDVLAIVDVGGRAAPSIILSRDFGDGVAYALLERKGPRRWSLRWTSAYAGC